MCPEQTLDERRQEVEKTKGEVEEEETKEPAATLKQTPSHTCSHTFRGADLGDLRSVCVLLRRARPGFLVSRCYSLTRIGQRKRFSEGNPGEVNFDHCLIYCNIARVVNL